MKIEEIISELEIFNEIYPKKAIIEARKNQEQIIPILLESLEYINNNAEKLYNEKNQEYYLYMYSIFLLAEFKEKKAFPIIIEILKKDEKILEYLFGDVLTEDMYKIVASTFDEDFKKLCDFVENRKNDIYARGAVLDSLQVLLKQEVVTRDFVKSFIKKLLDNLEDEEIEFATDIVCFISDTRFAEFNTQVKKLYENEMIDLMMIGDYSEYLRGWEFSIRNSEYINDTVESMSWWHCFNQKQEKTIFNFNKNVPIIKQSKIGRNDSCPCGSGKKYKKCCIDKDKTPSIDIGCTFEEWLKFENMDDDTEETIFEYYSEELNQLLMDICYSDDKKITIKEKVDAYLKIMNYVIDFAKEKGITNINELNMIIVDEFIMNIYYNFDNEIYFFNEKDYNLNIIIDFLDRLVTTFDIDDDLLYENILRTKCRLLFKLGKLSEGEKIMSAYIKDNPKSTYAYVELVDDFIEIGDFKKAKMYYDMGMAAGLVKDKISLEERKDSWYDNVKNVEPQQ